MPTTARGQFATAAYAASSHLLDASACGREQVPATGVRLCPTQDGWPLGGPDSGAAAFAAWGATKVDIARVSGDGRWASRVRLTGGSALRSEAPNWARSCGMQVVTCDQGALTCDAVAFSPMGWTDDQRRSLMTAIKAGSGAS